MKTNILKNWQAKIICLLLAILIYFLALNSVQTRREITIPLNVVLPASYTATSIVPESVNVVIKGTEDRIYMVDPKSMSASADFSKVNREGVSSVPVVLDLSSYIGQLSLDKVSIYPEPSSIKVYFEK